MQRASKKVVVKNFKNNEPRTRLLILKDLFRLSLHEMFAISSL